MDHEEDPLSRRIGRCERALFGVDDSSEGISSRTRMLETTVANIDATLKKLNWLIIAGVLVGILNLVLRSPSTPSSHQQSVNVGQADGENALAETSRDYVTTADIAKQEQVTERAVIDWISAGRIEPMPVKAGKSWTIAKNFRIIRQDAECCGETPNNEPDNQP
jgi:hypothetical protein